MSSQPIYQDTIHTQSQDRTRLQHWQRQADQTAQAARSILTQYQPISLDQMEAVALLRRVDTKYILHSGQLFQALAALSERYQVLEIKGTRLNRYHNLYFDTPELRLYHQHHRGRRDRFKVRSRQYVDTGLVYLEIKRKNNRDQTIKRRLKTSRLSNNPAQSHPHFLSDHYPYDAHLLQPVLWNDFMRITLVSRRAVERLTLDINLSFSNGWDQVGFPGLAVAEVKQDGFSIHSDFIQQMRAMKVVPQRFSKYCLGITHYYPQVKSNRFKRRSLMIGRIMQEGVTHGSAA